MALTHTSSGVLACAIHCFFSFLFLLVLYSFRAILLLHQSISEKGVFWPKLKNTILHFMENVMVCDSSLSDSYFLFQIR